MTLDQLGAKMRCKKCGKRLERYYAAKQERHAGVRSKLVELSNVTCIEKAAAKSKTEFNGAGGLLTYISFTPASKER
jgi:hypothetical protein